VSHCSRYVANSMLRVSSQMCSSPQDHLRVTNGVAVLSVSSLTPCEQEPLERKLYPGMAPSGEPKVDLGADQYSRFEDMHFADQMAVDKLKVRRRLRAQCSCGWKLVCVAAADQMPKRRTFGAHVIVTDQAWRARQGRSLVADAIAGSRCSQEGINSFSSDQLKLEAMIAELKENPEYPA